MFANHRAYWKTGISVVLMLAASGPATAQSDRQRTRVFTLEEAVAFALENYPAVRASLERLRSAEAGVTIARTSYLPRTDVLWQSNRATDNNITGLTLPNSVIAPITGPVPLSPSNRSAWVREGAEAAKSALKSITEIEGYLQVRAPLDGIVTERNVHPGSLVGPATISSGAATPMLRVEKTARLRLIVPVPEKYATGINLGSKVEFSVPAFPSQTFAGTIARVAHSVDVKTRTMPVELDVNNSDGRLSSGMFPEVLWPVRRTEPTLFVPLSAVARTTEATFVIRIREGNTEWVNVQTGELDGKSIEVFGDLREGDEVAVRGTDELRDGTHVVTKQVAEAATAK